MGQKMGWSKNGLVKRWGRGMGGMMWVGLQQLVWRSSGFQACTKKTPGQFSWPRVLIDRPFRHIGDGLVSDY